MTSRTARLALGGIQAGGQTESCEYAPGVRLPHRAPSFLGQLRLKLKSDEELMQHLQDGEADALAILFHRHSALVFRIALRILRDAGEAEDAVQQVFLDLFRTSERFHAEKGGFKAWLLTFAYHRTFNRRRHLLAARFYAMEEIEDSLPVFLERAQRPFPFSPSEIALLVQEGLTLLKPRQRRTIELVYYEGLTAEEVAAQTGESIRVVRHNLYRGMEKLRGVLCMRGEGCAPAVRRQSAETRR